MPKDKGVKRNKGDDGPPKKLKRVDEKETDMTKGTIRKEEPLNEHERLLKSVKNSLLFDENKPNLIANEEKESDKTKPEPLAILNESHEELDSMLKGSFPATSNQNSIATNGKIESMSKPIVQHQEDEIERQQRLREQIKKLEVELKFAVCGRNLRKIKQLIEFFRFDALKIATGADEMKPIMSRELQYSLLSLAISSKDFQIVKFFTDRGFDVNYPDLEGCEIPLLHRGIHTGDRLIVRELLDKGADIDAKANDFKSELTIDLDMGESTTALHHATALNQEDVVKMLLEKGANVVASDSDGQMPMHYAALNGNVQIAEILDKYGPSDIYLAENNHGMVPSDIATKHGFLDFFEFLVDKMKSWARLGNSSIMKGGLLYAAENGHNEIVEFIMDFEYEENGISILIDYDLWDSSVLHKAAITDNWELAELLLEHILIVDSTNSEGQTPLHCNAYTGEAKVVKILLEHGADIDASDYKGNTPLHTAVYWGNESLIKLLIDHGANVLEENENGQTALDIGIEEGQRISEFFIKCAIFKYSNDSIVCSEFSNTLKNHSDLLLFWGNHLWEMQSLKWDTIENTNVKLFDIFNSQNLTQLASYARNKSIENACESVYLYFKFPTYQSGVRKAFGKGIYRKKLEEKARRTFHSLFDNNNRKLPMLPSTVTTQMISYLTNDDLINFTS